MRANAYHLMMNIQRVASHCDRTRDYLREFCLKKLDKKWIVITNDKTSDFDRIKHSDNINLDDYDAVWIDEWPALYSREEFLFELFSKERLLIFSQKFEFPMDQIFFNKWSLQYTFLLKEKLAPCIFSMFTGVIREYSYSYPSRVHSLHDFSKNSLPYLKQTKIKGTSAFISHEVKLSKCLISTVYLWLNGRQRPQEMLLSQSENKARGNSNQKNALSGQAYYWRSFTSLWENCLGYLLWWARWRKKAKELNLRTWLPYWNRASA